MSKTSLIAHPLVQATIRPTEDFFSWTQNMASQAELTIKIVFAAIIVGAAVVMMIKTKFRIASIVGILASLGLAYWIVLGGGFSFGGETVKDTFTASMISIAPIRL